MPMESVQFRFDNLGSHFIRVQIFQIYFLLTPSILSASKYFRYSCMVSLLGTTFSHHNTMKKSQLLKMKKGAELNYVLCSLNLI